MKTRKFVFIILIAIFFSSCVVYSFYPIYTNKDLFPNDILTGEWSVFDKNKKNDNSENVDIWKFEHPCDKKTGKVDSLSYCLTTFSIKESDTVESVFNVHLIKIEETYLLDFYLEETSQEVTNISMNLKDFHVIPVHTFAKLTLTDDKLTINWFDPDWLEDLITENKIRIRHEDNGDYILLTAQPEELQKFVKKYVNSEDAFEDGLEVELKRK